jgi:hypothetical protein
MIDIARKTSQQVSYCYNIVASPKAIAQKYFEKGQRLTEVKKIINFQIVLNIILVFKRGLKVIKTTQCLIL